MACQKHTLCQARRTCLTRQPRIGSGNRRALSLCRDGGDDVLKRGVGVAVFNLTGSGVRMTAAAVFEHQFADIRLRRAIQNRFADRKHGILLFHAP